MHGPRSQNAPERGADQCEQPDGAGRWCGQMVPVASYNRHGALHTAKTRRAQVLHADAPCNHYAQTLGAALRAIAQRNRSRKRSAHSLGAALRANARHIRSTTRWTAAPARTVKVFSQRMPVFWLTLSISGDGLRPFGVKKTSLAMSALRYPLFWHVFIAKCRTQRPSARKPRRLSAINRQS